MTNIEVLLGAGKSGKATKVRVRGAGVKGAGRVRGAKRKSKKPATPPKKRPAGRAAAAKSRLAARFKKKK